MKAKGLIKKLINELSIENVKEQSWKDTAYSYIFAIFGDDKQSIATPMYQHYYADKSVPDDTKAKELVEIFGKIFAAYLVMIDNGVYLRKNIFSRYSDLEVFALIISIGLAIMSLVYGLTYCVAYTQGQRLTDYRVLELKQEYKILKDSLVKCNEQHLPRGNKTDTRTPSSDNKPHEIK